MVTKFKNHLARTNLARNTINSYVWTIEYFLNHYGEVNKRNLLAYKGYLVENFKPQTVNLRLQGINKYLEFTKQEKLKVKFVKVQQKNFLENVISDADYKFLKARLKTDGYDEWYFIVWFMAATGARVSELLHIKAEHIGVGYLDLYSKGGKMRRLYIPKTLRTEADKWLKGQGLTPRDATAQVSGADEQSPAPVIVKFAACPLLIEEGFPLKVPVKLIQSFCPYVFQSLPYQQVDAPLEVVCYFFCFHSFGSFKMCCTFAGERY